MNNIILNEIDLLDIGYGLKIGLDKSGVWQVWAKNGRFDLKQATDFWRIVTLLERPYSEIKSIINEFTEQLGSEIRFPYYKVVSAGLTFELDHWASLALSWFSYLEHDEQIMLVNLLDELEHSNWASQKSRHLARRCAKQIRAVNMDA